MKQTAAGSTFLSSVPTSAVLARLIHNAPGRSRDAALVCISEAWPKTSAALVTTSFRKPFTSKDFSNSMAERIELSGRSVTLGFRKAAALKRLAQSATGRLGKLDGMKSPAPHRRLRSALTCGS
ncbi:MAG: hypothetical protein ACLP7P_04330 [Rhodomicrobium sp.]